MSEAVKKESPYRRNLRAGFSTPGGKMTLVLILIALVAFVGLGYKAFSTKSGPRAGGADAGGFELSGTKPRGATDPMTASAVAKSADEASAEAVARGQSYGGPFVFESNSAAASGAQAGAVNKEVAEIFSALQKKALEYDSSDDSSRAGGTNNTTRTAESATPNSQSADYGVGSEGFKQMTSQLDRANRPAIQYDSLAGGVLSLAQAAPSAPPVTAAILSPSSSIASPGGPALAITRSEAATEFVAARAGSICAGTPDAKIDTDFSLPVFVSLHNCGELSGARVRGTIVKSADDFTVRFVGLFFDPAKKLKLSGAFDAIAVNVMKDGDPAIADDVDRHWLSRIGSSALLRLAKIEQQFISNRSTTSTTTGISNTTTVEPPSTGQRRSARVAGLLEGTMEVVTADTAAGVTRPATMTTKKTTLIGIQFLDDIKVVRLD